MKKRTRRGDPQKRTYWEGVVKRWQDSGQSVRAFCRAEGLRDSAFFFWRRRLAQSGPGDPAPGGDLQRPDAISGPRPQIHSALPASRLTRSGHRRMPDATPSFLPVQVATPVAAEATCSLEIVLTHGRTVRVRPGFDRQMLADVLAVLEARPC
jgi:transposase-like protein